jgi:hypothetical protein
VHIFSILFLTVFTFQYAFAGQCTEFTEGGKTYNTCDNSIPASTSNQACPAGQQFVPDDDQAENPTGKCVTFTKTQSFSQGALGIGGNTANGNDCETVQKLYDACEKNNKKAVDDCNPEKEGDYTSVIAEANSISSSVNTLSGGALAASCNKLLQLTQATTSALGIYEGSCRESRSACMTSCENLYKKAQVSCSYNSNAIKTANDNKTQCEEELKVKESQAGANAQRLMGLAMQTKMCKQQFAALPGFNLDDTKLDCNNPALAGNKICKCRNPANAGDPDCGGSVAGSGGGLELGSQGSPYSNGKGVDLNKMNLSTNDPAMPIGEGGQENNENVGGKKGNGVNLGSSSGSNGSDPNRPGGGGGTGYNTNVNGGYGRGGGGAFGSAGRSGGGAAGYAGTAGQPGLPNLNKFRPNMAYQPGGRNLAGVSGPDGILGPHADLWLQVKNRYNYKNQQGQFLAP